MAWNYYFNMEVMALDIATEHIDAMSETNHYEDVEMKGIINDDLIYGNIKNGFVVITQLSCYVESFLNTVLNRCIGYDGMLLRKNVEDKIDILFLKQPNDCKKMRSHSSYQKIKEAAEVRNAMIHWKKNYIGEGTPLPEFCIGGARVTDFFTKGNMKRLFDDHVLFCSLIAEYLHLKINECASVFEAEARDGLVNYVYNPAKTDIDPSRWCD